MEEIITLNKLKINVKIVGPCPPPFGGVSIHTARLAQSLKTKNICVEYFDDFQVPKSYLIFRIRDFFLGKKSKKYISTKTYFSLKIKIIKYFWLVWFKLLIKDYSIPTIFHYQSHFWKYRALFSLISHLRPKSKTIFTVHSLREKINDFNFVFRFYIKFALKNTSHIIVTNGFIKNKLIHWGADEKKISVLNPFIPPIETNHESFIPVKVEKFLNNNSPIISANASKMDFYNGADMYGIDLAIELCHKLKEGYPNIGFVFVLSQISNKSYYKKLIEKLEEYNITENFKFVVESLEFFPILKKSDLFIRPTNTDGDAISIREALHFKIPTIASDCIERPNGVTIFRNRDLSDLLYVTDKILSNIDARSQEISHGGSTNSVNEIISIYYKTINNNLQ